MRSDAYVLTDDYQLELSPPRRDGPPTVSLDRDYFKLLADFDARLPFGPPSLVECERLVVEGDVLFGRGLTVRGSVRVAQTAPGQLRIEDGALLEG